MSDCSRQLTESRHSRHMSQLCLRLALLFLCAFAFGNVYSRPEDFNEFAGFTEDGMAYSVNVPNLAVRKNDPVVELGISLFRDLGISQPFCSILGMNSLENGLIGRYTGVRIKPKQLVAFLRPVGDLFSSGFQRPTAAFAQRLRFR